MSEYALRTNRHASTNAAERIISLTHMLDKRCIRHNRMFVNTYPTLDRNGHVFTLTTVVQLIQETMPYAIINHELYIDVIDTLHSNVTTLLENKTCNVCVCCIVMEQTLHQQERDSINLPCTNTGKTVDDPLHTVDDPLHIVDDPLHTVDDPLHKVDDPLHTVNDPLHTVDDPLHKVDDPLHTVDDPLHTVDDPLHTVDDPLHTVDDPLHTSDDPLHKVDDPLHTVDDPLHTADDPLHTVDDPRHTVVLLGFIESSTLRANINTFNPSIKVYRQSRGQCVSSVAWTMCIVSHVDNAIPLVFLIASKFTSTSRRTLRAAVYCADITHDDI